MPNEAGLLRLALAAHEAAADPSQWEPFLAGYARETRGDVACLQRHFFAEHRSELFATFGMTQHFSDSYNQHYSRLNVWREHGSHAYRTGRIILDQETYPRPLLKRSEFFNDYLLPNHGTQSLAGVIRREHDTATVLTVLRDETRPAWEESERQMAAALLPHVDRAFATRDRLNALDARTDALNALGHGVLLLKASGKIAFANRAAEAILRRGDGLTAANGILTAADTRTSAALRRLIAFALQPARSLQCPPLVLVTRPSLRRAYQVVAAPYFRLETGLAKAVAVVFLVDPDETPRLSTERLQAVCGLTAREAALASHLAAGRPLDETAKTLGITYETARTHLRRVFDKTETSRQSELVSMLIKMASQWPDAPDR